MVLGKKKIIILILILIFSSVLFIYSNGEAVNKEDNIIVNENLLIEEINTLNSSIYENKEEPNIEELVIPFYESENKLDKVCSDFESTELYKMIDLNTFKPSYNLLVTYALSEIGNTNDKFSNNLENWSLDFLMWCNFKSEFISDIPVVTSIEELMNFYKDLNSFYLNATTCYPLIGDIVLIDDNSDSIADRVSIVSNVENGIINVVGGSIWSDTEKEYIVKEIKYSFDAKEIVGICRPNYGLNHKADAFSDFGLPFNAVDTIMYLREDSYAYNLADKGIKVIARYINPEGRYPLDLEEVERFSNAGVRLMMIYQVNKDDPYKGYEKGIELGTKALSYAKELQAPKGTPIFFCCDCANRFESFDKVAEFLVGVREAMQGEYGVGLYGGYYVNEAMYNLGLLDAYWQCWGFSDGYLSKNADIVQYTTGQRFFDDIPYYYDANYVKNIEKVSFIKVN